MHNSGDPHCRITGRPGFIGQSPVPDRFAAACDCANRLFCRFDDVDAEDPLRALRLYALWVQVIAARPSAGVREACSLVWCLLSLPRLNGVTRARY